MYERQVHLDGQAAQPSRKDALHKSEKMRPPRFQRGNPKARKVQPVPTGTDLNRVAESSLYDGSPYHKDAPGPAGPPRRRPDASICPRYLTEQPELVVKWLRDAIRAGRTGAWDRGYPSRAWHREGDIVFEARQGSPGSGKYHGYPLEPHETVRGL